MRLIRIDNIRKVWYFISMKKHPSHDQLKSLLKEKGFKVTPGRLSILSILNKKHIPLSAEDIFKDLKGKKTDYATVYRTLASFEKAGIIKRVDLHKDEVYFEIVGDHHHHLVCTGCGTIEDFETC